MVGGQVQAAAFRWWEGKCHQLLLGGEWASASSWSLCDCAGNIIHTYTLWRWVVVAMVVMQVLWCG